MSSSSSKRRILKAIIEWIETTERVLVEECNQNRCKPLMTRLTRATLKLKRLQWAPIAVLAEQGDIVLPCCSSSPSPGADKGGDKQSGSTTTAPAGGSSPPPPPVEVQLIKRQQETKQELDEMISTMKGYILETGYKQLETGCSLREDILVELELNKEEEEGADKDGMSAAISKLLEDHIFCITRDIALKELILRHWQAGIKEIVGREEKGKEESDSCDSSSEDWSDQSDGEPTDAKVVPSEMQQSTNVVSLAQSLTPEVMRNYAHAIVVSAHLVGGSALEERKQQCHALIALL